MQLDDNNILRINLIILKNMTFSMMSLSGVVKVFKIHRHIKTLKYRGQNNCRPFSNVFSAFLKKLITSYYSGF